MVNLKQMNHNGRQEAISLRDIMYVLFRYKKAVLSIFCASLATVYLGLLIWPESYEANASLLVKIGRENVAPLTVPQSSQQQMITAGIRKEDINSEIAMLANQYVIEKAVQQLGVDFIFPPSTPPPGFFKRIKFEFKRGIGKLRDLLDEVMYFFDLKKRLSIYEKIVLAIQNRLVVKQLKDSDVIEIQLRWFNPEIATAVIETILKFYLEHHLEIHQISGGQKFFQNQVEILGNRLKEGEELLQELKTKQGIFSYDQQNKMLLEQLTAYQTDLKNTETELAQISSKISEIKRKLASLPENIQLSKNINRNPLIEPLKQKLVELELEKNNIEKKYLDDARPVINIKDQITEVKNKLKKEVENISASTTIGLNNTYRDMQKDLFMNEVYFKSGLRKKEELEKHIDEIKKQLERLSEQEVAFRRLNRQIQVDEENYLIYRKKLEEARISNVLDAERIVNIRVINHPTASFTPVRPRKLMILGTGIVMSLFFALGFAFLAGYLDVSLNTEEDVKRCLDLPLLGTISEDHIA